jgi:3-oxoadipate enol-lactonase
MEEPVNIEGDFVDTNDTRFFVETAGDGAWLVMLHAGITDARMWDEQFATFARHFRVMRYDRRGFGRTETRSGVSAYSHREDLYELLHSLGIKRAILMGCSQGGKIVTDFTLSHPGMTEALILVAPALGGFEFVGEEPLQLKELERADEAGDIERVNELELQIWVDGPVRQPHEVNHSLRERVREMNRMALSAPQSFGTEQPLQPPAVTRLKEIRVPTLVIVGGLDTPRTLAASRLLAEEIDGARMVIIEGTAHLPNMERPKEFNRHVLSFLGRS